jgi:signal transduction histidine kinase
VTTAPAPLAAPGWRDVARAPVSLRSWCATAQVVLDLLVGVAGFVLVVVGVSLAVGLVPLFLLGVPVLVATLLAAHGLARFELARLAAFTGVRVPARPLPALQRTGWAGRLLERLRTAGLWKEAAYAVLLLPVGAVGAGLVVGLWAGGLALLALPVLAAGAAPGAGVLGEVPLVVLVAAGLVCLLVAPWVARGWAAVDVALARWLLAPAAGELLAARVVTLEDTRARVVAAADAERRRIERDLHDGAQQRLVALAMSLGRARQKLDDDPDGARLLLDEAHGEAKHALAELRDLARGLHPAVLTDRGLDAALSALAARCPVPVDVEVDVAVRPSPTVEAVAYFVVAEALTNVAKHAHARSAAVVVRRDGDVLRVRVRDDGVGGARTALGTGLTGLADRVAAVDGDLTLSSPPGGPTELEVVLPCAS